MKISRRDFLLLSGISPTLFSKKKREAKKPSVLLQLKPKFSRYDPWLELNLDHLG